MSTSRILNLKLVTHDKYRNQLRAYGRLSRTYQFFGDLMADDPPPKPEVQLDRVMLHARYEDDPVALALLDLTEQLIEANTRGQASADQQDKIIEAMEATMQDYNERIASMSRTLEIAHDEKQAYDEAIAESFLDAKQRRRLTALLTRKLRIRKEIREKGFDADYVTADGTLRPGVEVVFEPVWKSGKTSNWTDMVKDTMGRSQPYGAQIRGKGTKRP
jgi:hypothetical protein